MKEESPELLECKDKRAQLAPLVQMGNQESLDQKDHLERRAPRVHQARLVQLEQRAQ